MGPEEILAELRAFHELIRQGGAAAAADPAVGKRLLEVTARLKEAVGRAMGDLNSKIEATASDLRAKAEAMARKAEAKKNPPPPGPLPVPWEEHQGLSQDAMADLVAVTLRAAAARPR